MFNKSGNTHKYCITKVQQKKLLYFASVFIIDMELSLSHSEVEIMVVQVEFIVQGLNTELLTWNKFTD